ncbi:MAG: sensor histidine kinase [Turicibacter sp.]
MEEQSFIVILRGYIKGQAKTLGLFSMILIIFVCVFALYGIKVEPILYATLLSVWMGLIVLVYDFIRYKRKYQELSILKKQIQINLTDMPLASDLIEKEYQTILLSLMEHTQNLTSNIDSKQTDMMDYFTLWAHQIKTPIAAIRLLVQSHPGENDKELLGELFKIEQYVEMVLGYLRIENVSSDLAFHYCDLAGLVKQAIRKYSSQFIRKNIKLEFKEMDILVLTDEKWLVFVIEQLLSNAIKYSSSGTISIYMNPSKAAELVIEDTGIGIAQEDLPRIFEKGFTGYNGRMDKKATGIGLYLCQKVLRKLSHTIFITSQVGVGTTVKIDLATIQTRYE